MRTGVMGVLAVSLVFCAAGCARRAAPPERALPDPATAVDITILVQDMTKKLQIT
jgi:hypothetical protein